MKLAFSRRKILSLFITVIIVIIGLVGNYSKQITPTPQKPVTVQPTLTPLATSSAQLAKVARVVDGDTIELETGQKVRYIGIDTPELHHPKKSIQCFGEEAKEINDKLVTGKSVRLVKDVSETDRYGRLLRYVYLDDATASPSSLFINDYLVREGYAYAATFPPDVHFSDTFRQLQNEAAANHKGLWNSCPLR